MNYIEHSFRNADVIFNNDPRYAHLWGEITSAVAGITDAEIVASFNANTSASKKSISDDINKLLDTRLVSVGWTRQSPIFDDPQYTADRHRWTLDFAKEEISLEVAFNHGEAIAWNLIKPVLAGELNHVRKAIQTSAGVIICTTEAMRYAGNFDSSVGTYEKFLRYLDPFRNILTVPMMIVGLTPPETFRIDGKSKSVVTIP